MGEATDPAAVMGDHAGVVRLLLAAGASLGASARCSWGPLHFAAYYGSQEAVVELVSAGADINEKDAGGSRPLHLSVYGDLWTALLLVRLGASTILCNNAGVPAVKAAAGGCSTVEEFLRWTATSERRCVFCGAGGRYLHRCSRCRGSSSSGGTAEALLSCVNIT